MRPRPSKHSGISVKPRRGLGPSEPWRSFLLFFVCILDYIGVGFVIPQGEKIAYNWSTKLFVNSEVSTPINAFSSERQRCPISPFLFGISLDPFCHYIQHCKDIRRFTLNETEVKLLVYSDDIAIFCSDLQSISRNV